VRLPDAVALAGLPLHVVVRDFPEALAVLRGFGLELPESGGESLAAGAGAQAAAVYEALCQATAWRESARPGRCDRAAAQAATRRASALAAELAAGLHPVVPPPG